jgi:hypothetical protein
MGKVVLGFALGAITMGIAVSVIEDAHAASNDAVSVGPGVRFICQTSAPSPVGRGRLWMRCSDGALVYTTAANTDYTVKP